MISFGFPAPLFACSGFLPCTQWRPEVPPGESPLSLLPCVQPSVEFTTTLNVKKVSWVPAFPQTPVLLLPSAHYLPPSFHSVNTLRKVIASRCRFTVARDLQDSNPSLKLIPAVKISLHLQWSLLPPLPSPATKAAISLFPPRKGLSIALIFQLI